MALCPGQNLGQECGGRRRAIPWSALGGGVPVCLMAEPLHCSGARRGVAPKGPLAPSQDRVSSGLAEPPSPLWWGTSEGKEGADGSEEADLSPAEPQGQRGWTGRNQLAQEGAAPRPGGVARVGVGWAGLEGAVATAATGKTVQLQASCMRSI